VRHAGAGPEAGNSEVGWGSEAASILREMQAAGAEVDAASALQLLTMHMSVLQPQDQPEDPLEAATPVFSDISSRFSLSGGHRYGTSLPSANTGTCLQYDPRFDACIHTIPCLSLRRRGATPLGSSGTAHLAFSAECLSTGSAQRRLKGPHSGIVRHQQRLLPQWQAQVKSFVIPLSTCAQSP